MSTMAASSSRRALSWGTFRVSTASKGSLMGCTKRKDAMGFVFTLSVPVKITRNSLHP